MCIKHRRFDTQSGDKQHQPGDADGQRVVGDHADRAAVFFGHHVTQRMHHRGAENRQHPEQFGMVQMQPWLRMIMNRLPKPMAMPSTCDG